MKLKQVTTAGKPNDEALIRLLFSYSRRKSDFIGRIIDMKTKIPAIRNIVNAAIDPLYTEYNPEFALGNHSVGRYAYNEVLPVNLSLADITMSLALVPTGSGKSMTIMNLAHSVIFKNLPDENIAIITPKRNSEWRNLVPLNIGNILYFTKENFFFQPLEEINNVSMQDNARNFVSIFVSEMRFMEGVASYLYDCIIELKTKNKDCNLFDLVKLMARKNEKSLSLREYNCKALNRLKMLTEELKQMLNVTKGIRTFDLATKNWIFELVTQSESVFSFITSLILSRIFLWKTANE